MKNPYESTTQARYRTPETINFVKGIDFSDSPSKTKQEPAEDADINVLMMRFGVTDGSELPYYTRPAQLFNSGDFSNMPTDPVDMMNMLREGELEFMKLPANLRARFENAAGLYTYMVNPDNRDEAEKLGILAFDPKTDDTTSAVSSSTGSVKASPVPTPTE